MAKMIVSRLLHFDWMTARPFIICLDLTKTKTIVD